MGHIQKMGPIIRLQFKHYTMKRFLQLITLMTGLLVVGTAEAQTTVSNESIPNSFNTGFTRPINSTFTGSIGTWAAFSTDANATIVCNGAYVQTTPNALKIVNYNNSGSGTASTCRATSPTVNLGSLGCTNSVALSFKLYTYTLNVNNTCFSFFVEFSSDNGTNWTTIWSRTAQQLVQSFGSGTWTTQNIPIPATYFNSTFKYRLRGTQAAGCAYDSYLYVDDIKILSQACLTTCTTGFNPTAEAKGFNVFTKDGAKFMDGHTDGGVAMGGDLTLQGATTIAMNASYLTYPVTTDKFGLVIGGKMVYTSGGTSYLNSGKIRLANTTGSRLFYKDCNNATTNFRVTPFNATCATAYNSTPALQQQSTSANSDPTDINGLNFTDAFDEFETAAENMAAYTSSSSCASSLNIISISGNTPSVTLASNKINVINLTGTQLASLTHVSFNSAPTATNPLVINVNQTSSFNWTAPFGATGLTNASGQYIIFNFYNATGDITIGGANVLRGALFAPQAAIIWNNTNNLEGQAIARYFTLNGGEIHYQRFGACLPLCTASTTCTGNLLTNPGFENGTTNWDNWGNFTVTTSDVYTGTRAARVSGGEGGFAQYVNATAGTTFTLRAYAKISTGSGAEWAGVGIKFYNSSWTALGNEQNAQITSTAYQQYTITTTAPSGTAYAQAYVWKNNGSAIVRADDFCFTSSVVTCNPDDVNATSGYCAPAPTCSTGTATMLWQQSINSSNGEPSVVKLVCSGTTTYTIPSNLYPALLTGGTSVTVNISDVVSYDGYSTRNTVSQPNERWRLVFKKNGNTVGTTGYTTDVPDNVKQDYWRGSLGTVSLPNGADQVIIEHWKVAQDVSCTNGPNSVSPVSVCLTVTANTTLNLGNLVWNDINGDGDYDDNEPGVSGVTVRLYNDANGDNVPDGAAIATTTTNAQGIYGFSNLAAGNYIVGIVIPTGYIGSIAVTSSGNPNNNLDDDNNGVNFTGANQAGTEIRSNRITLNAGAEPTSDGDGNNGNLTLDFGLCGLGGLGNFVFNDLDKDGVQDANEVGIQGVSVTLTYPDGTQLTVPTDEDGLYFFANLGPGNHVVTFVTPAGQIPTLSNQGTNDAIDSDPVAGVVNVTLTAGQVNNTVDAGFYLTTCILQLGACGPGFVTKETTLIKNGNFSSSITSPASGNTYSGTGSITYNFSGGNFKAQSAYDGLNIKPGGERDFSIINNAGIFNGGCCDILQAAFPGDPANNVPASNTWLYHNGNDLGREYLVWEQTVTGLVVGRQYRFRFYASNAINGPNNADDPIVRIRIGGTSGSNDGTVVTGPVTLTESATANNTALNGWVRIEYSFTASATSMVFKITDSQTSTNGDDLGITAIGIESCFTDTDRDCVADVDDIDDDNDGILDIVESGGCDPLLDSDGDGIPNYKDSNAPGCQPWVDCNNDGINDNYDWDRDGIINELDLDSDNDGILDVQETRADNAVDNNRDGMVDGVDVDGDGLLSTADANDNVIGGPGLTPQDLDRDGKPNYLDLDSDGDGLTDITEALELYDTDGLTAGTDVDTDGVRAKGGLYTNVDDNADNFNGFGAKGIKLKDFDGDGKPNPYDVDSDQDGITDNVEGQPTCSNKVPCTTDVDGDGVGDCYDVNTSNCTSRTSGGITPYDKDGDGTPDIYDLDTDNDGAPDINEGSGREGGFVEDYTDVDGDGLIGEFDNFNINTALSNFTNNVAHGNMGPNGNLDGPIPSGSLAELPQSQVGSCPNVDRDWRNVSILPVTLMEFKGNLNNSIVNLQWKVTNEVNVERYIIERSTNGTNFTAIGAVNATAASTSIKDYQHADNIASLNTTIVYYRLITEDKGGSKAYSNTLVFRLGKAKSTMAINPNPASNFFNVRVQATKEGNAVVRVLDMTGRVVLTNNTKLFTGSNTISFHNAQQLAAGTYSVQMLLNGEVFTEKLVIIH